jgi:hypothetical protein
MSGFQNLRRVDAIPPARLKSDDLTGARYHQYKRFYVR